MFLDWLLGQHHYYVTFLGTDGIKQCHSWGMFYTKKKAITLEKLEWWRENSKNMFPNSVQIINIIYCGKYRV